MFASLLADSLPSPGTMRHLLVGLGSGNPVVVPGNIFREGLDRANLRDAFCELLQDPLILEEIDAVWCGRFQDAPRVEFHFTQPQSYQYATALGTITVKTARTVSFLVEESGDVILQRGDITLHWLMIREDLLLRLRRLETPDAPYQDILHISAGNILTRRVPLPPLTLPERQPIPVLPSTVPTAATAAPDLPEPETIFVVIHQVQGRVRFRVQALYRNDRLKEKLEQALRGQTGIRHVAASTLTTSLLVTFDASLSADEVGEWVLRVVCGLDIRAGWGVAKAVPPWHMMNGNEVARYWQSSGSAGLSRSLVAARQQEYGPNALPEPQPRSRWSIFVEQFKSLPVAMLGASAALSILTGGLADGIAILAVVLINAGIGYATENWAEEAIASLSKGVRPAALVIREGRESWLPGEALVPGDLIVLKRGLYVPADARLLDVDTLTVDESTLTGESIPVAKQLSALPEPHIPLADRTNMVYRGTVVTGGNGHALVVATGQATEIGQIQRLLTETRQPETPLQRQLRVLGGQLALVSAGVCGGVFALGLLRGQPFLQMMKVAVSLAVAAVPEGLPTVATTTLAMGVRRLHDQNVLVRKLNAVETLGALQYVCLDKTGTITLNRMTLVAVFVGKRHYQARGAAFYKQDKPVDGGQAPDLAQLLRLSVLCSEVAIIANDDEPELHGSPTETALVRGALHLGLDAAALRQQYPLRRLRLRSEQRTFMDTLHQPQSGEPLLAVKGHPMEVLALCRYQLQHRDEKPLTEADRIRIATENERMAGRALRVLGVAYRLGEELPEEAQDLVWVGLAGIADPPRPEIAHLLAQLHRAGIHTTMITGDQSATATAIAQEIGLGENGRLQTLDSAHLETLEADVLRTLALQVDVFSRVSPAHKLQIVRALQESGRVVAMTGDGINDGPALRAADIGIAMGKDGSDVAQEVADIIIHDDDLATLVGAIEQGRTIYDDIRKAVHFILASNTSEILLTLIAAAGNLGEPLNPMQLLWINLSTDIFPELALGLEPPETDVMRRAPRDPQAPMFARADLQRIGREGVLLTAGALGSYLWGIGRYGLGPQASTLAFTSLTSAQLLHALSCRSEPHSVFDPRPFPRNPYITLAVGGGLALQGLATLLPGLRSVLGAVPLGMLDWLVVGTTAVAPFFISETLKLAQASRQPVEEEDE